MSFIKGGRAGRSIALVVTGLLLNGASWAQNLDSLSLSDLIAAADRRMQARNYEEAIPILEEILIRTSDLAGDQERKAAQNCRFELARIYYQQGDIAAGMVHIEAYLDNEPRLQERRALGMLAQGFFAIKDWEKIIDLYRRLLAYKELDNEVRFNMTLLAGQAYFNLERYEECLGPLRAVEKETDDERIRGVCQIMVARALVELESWGQLYAWVLRVNRTDRRYDISMNLTLMKAARRLYENEEYLNSLMLYRMVLPRGELIDFADKKTADLNTRITLSKTPTEAAQLQSELDELQGAVALLKELPPYEEEATFRIAQIYFDVKRYWEAFALFEQLCQEDPDSEIGAAAALQAVMVLYAVGENDRAEARAVAYLDEHPDGRYIRTLLSALIRQNLLSDEFDRAIGFRKYIQRAAQSDLDENEKEIQAELHYMQGFAYLQAARPREAAEQFMVVLDMYPDSEQWAAALYYLAMSYMMQADYAAAMNEFKRFQETYEENELYSESIFREGVCLYGLERIPDAEAVFTHFVETYPDHPVVSEAYSLRGDIEAAKEASIDDPHTLDRAQADYRKAIDTARLPLQASYAAFQAAEVYKMEFKWQDIIDLMNYYINRWEEMADVAEAIYWTGRAQIQLGQLHEEAIPAYIDGIIRFGNDPRRQGVDKIINSLVEIADKHLSQDEREGLMVRLRVKRSNLEGDLGVLRLRLQLAEALLEGEDVARALASDLVDSLENLWVTTPGSLALMCDVAVDSGDFEQMKRLSDYFLAYFEDSELRWHGFRARTLALMAEEKYEAALAAIDEAQGEYGVESFMGWSQIQKAKARYGLGDFEEAENEYNMALNVPAWRGPVFAEAMYGMGECRLATSDFEAAHGFFQRTYLLFKAYENGDWAAKGYIAAADCLIKLGRKSDAVRTLKAMLDDEYTKSNTLAVKVRELLSTYGGK